MSSRRPDAATSSGLVVKDEPADDDDHRVPPDDDDDNDNEDDDPIVRTIDVYISPALSNTLHLLQFPIEPARRRRQHHRGGRGGGGGIDKDDEDDDDDVPSPTEARFRPRHNMLELDYPLPQFRRDLRRLPSNVATMMTTRTHSSNSVAPNTHLALARLDDSGSRLRVVPLIRHALQMRPSFAHLDDVDGDGDGEGGGDGDGEGGHDGTTTTTGIVADRRPDDDRGTNIAPGQRRRPIMFAKREGSTTEFHHPGGAGGGRRAPHAQKRASEAAEGWIVLDVVRGGGGGADDGGKRTMSFGRETSSSFGTRRGEGNGEDRAPMGLAGYDEDDDEDDDCADVPYSADDDGGCDECGARYVRSLNYLDSYPSGRGGGGGGGATPPSGGALVEDPWEWSPPNAPHEYDDSADHVDASEAGGVGATERAAAELAARLATLMQSGNGTMIPYCVLRSQFHPTRVPDELLTVALSSCAVLVRGNFALKSTLAKFLAANGGGEGRKKSKSMRELRDLILLLLNMHGMVQRERLARAYSSRGGGERRRRTDGGYDPIIDPDTITFVLKTVARKSHHCWVAKVDDDEEFAAKFPEVAACHAIYWMKKKEMLADLIELYENVGGGGQEC
ncbi:hypothetical protein ACHAW5_009153 [Stephanodiscus triporus]|uniref:Uncharacterized protein n=1 Tax=Stephanodiscus triporus TaxID=2934178 RepID=A0ABD3N1K4_9STRA